MAAQRLMQIVDLAGIAGQPLARIPAGIKFSGGETGFGALRHWQLRVENCAADFEMRIERFACNEEPHDFARSFEDEIDPAITQETLDRDRFLAATGEGLRRFVTTAAAHLHG